MRYRKFGRLEWECSALGLGVSQVPEMGGGDSDAISGPELTRIVRQGVDGGINFIHLGLPWNMMDRHERMLRAVGRALQDGYRERVKLAVSIPSLMVSSAADFDLHLERQLSWLGVESADFCLVGRLARDNWLVLQENGIVDWIEDALADGRVGHAGFSFHDQYQVLRGIVQAYDRWALCSVDYSLMDVNHDPGANGIRYAAEQGLAVVVTHPFKGGRLTREPPEEVAQVWARSPREWSRAEWALRFALNHPGVSVVVSDMTSAEQLIENMRVAGEAGADQLSVADEVTISNVRDVFRKRQQVPCPSCRPCMPCPEGIDVPRFFEICNDAAMYEDVETARSLCAAEQIYPGQCNGCGVCEARCAKRLPIVDLLVRGRSFLRLD